MNLGMFFEGTGQGVAGKITNVTRLRDFCVDDARQKLHLEAWPGTHFGSYLAGKIAGVDWRTTFRSARRQTSGERSIVSAATSGESGCISHAKGCSGSGGDFVCPREALIFSGRLRLPPIASME